MDSQESILELIEYVPPDLTYHQNHLGKGKRVLLIEDDDVLLEIILQNDEQMEVVIEIVEYTLTGRGEPADVIDVYPELTHTEAINIISNTFDLG